MVRGVVGECDKVTSNAGVHLHRVSVFFSSRGITIYKSSLVERIQTSISFTIVSTLVLIPWTLRLQFACRSVFQAQMHQRHPDKAPFRRQHDLMSFSMT